MRSSSTPPRWMVYFLERLLSRDRAEFLLGDLEEDFHALAQDRGAVIAQRWFRRQVWKCLGNEILRKVSESAQWLASPRRVQPQDWLSDLRLAWRRLSRQRGFTATIVVTLALGIAVNTSMFTLLNGLILRPLPYPDPERLVHLGETLPELENIDLSYPDFSYWREQSSALEFMAVYDDVRRLLSGRGNAIRLEGAQVSWGLFPTLGIAPALGRGFSRAEDSTGGDPVVVISDRLWEEQLEADPQILGQTLRLSDSAYTIIGIMPEGFHFPEIADFWIPVGLDPSQTDPLAYDWDAIARLKDGFTVESAQAEANLIAAQLSSSYPGQKSGLGGEVYPLRSADVPQQAQQVIWLLSGAVGLVLLIACINISNLMLVNFVSRLREISLKMALGANRYRVFRQLFCECLLLGIGGGLLGLLLGVVSKDWVVSLIPLQFAYWIRFDLDYRVFCFVAGASLACVFLMALLVSVAAGRVDLTRHLKSRGASGATNLGPRMRAGLISFEVALSMALLIAAGLMMRTFVTLAFDDPGFDSSNTLSLRIWVPEFKYSSAAQRAQLRETLEARVSTIPGVTQVAATTDLPQRQARLVYYHVQASDDDSPQLSVAYEVTVSGSYFNLLRVPLLQGRTFVTDDLSLNQRSPVVVSRSLAVQTWPGESAIGQRLYPGRTDVVREGERPWHEVVGVVEDLQHGMDWNSSRAAIYYPMATVGRTFSLLIRSAGALTGLGTTIQGEIAATDRDIPVYSILPLSQIRLRDLWMEELVTALFSSFGLLALTLAAVGIHGLIGFEVARQKHALSVRLAIGARTPQLVRQSLWSGLRPVFLGMILGLPLSLGLARLLTAALADAASLTPSTLLGTSLVLLLVAAVAGYLPTRAIAKVDPCQVLKEG